MPEIELEPREQRAANLLHVINAHDMKEDCAKGEIVAAFRAEAKQALLEFAGMVRDTWGQAYPADIFLPIETGEMDNQMRSRASAAMGRHMAAAIEKQLRERAAAVESGDD